MINNVNLNSQNNISFGHCGIEYVKYGKYKFVHTTESAFGRGFEQLDDAVKRVNKNFKNVKEKRFVVGACSTAQEVWTLKMLMEDNPVKILGFDPAPEAIKVAKSGTYEFFSEDSKKVKYHGITDGYRDIYLAYDKQNKTFKETKMYKMFHNMFKQVDFKTWNPFKEPRRIFKLRYQQPDCTFISADIRNLPPELTKDKCHLFSFRNAFYHILTFRNRCSNDPRATKKVKPLLNSIFKQVNRALENKGIFLMSSNECYQCPNSKLITKALLKNGFKPLIHNEKFCYMWEKTKEI